MCACRIGEYRLTSVWLDAADVTRRGRAHGRHVVLSAR
jgi:hypothetical protein